MILEKKEGEFKGEQSRSESWKNKKEEDGDGKFVKNVEEMMED